MVPILWAVSPRAMSHGQAPTWAFLTFHVFMSNLHFLFRKCLFLGCLSLPWRNSALFLKRAVLRVCLYYMNLKASMLRTIDYFDPRGNKPWETEGGVGSGRDTALQPIILPKGTFTGLHSPRGNLVVMGNLVEKGLLRYSEFKSDMFHRRKMDHST